MQKSNPRTSHKLFNNAVITFNRLVQKLLRGTETDGHKLK
jgi:hypothetical protein